MTSDHSVLPEPITILHEALPREGPGSDECTQEALRRLRTKMPDRDVLNLVLDLGCGPGRQSLVLAKALKTRVIAVDIHQPFLDQLYQRATAEGLSHFIETRCGDFGALDIPAGSADLIWSEGAAYVLGFAESLRLWQRLLKPGGLMAVTECTWLTNSPPEEPLEFWRAAYPSMGTVDENCRGAETAGLSILDTFALPESAWWIEYYTPLLARIAQLRPGADPSLTALLDETEREIELFRRYAQYYGYVFYLLRT